jgi:catechol 2,3-dioxygenase-like lactoylglutathione lyase family enzyme
VGVRFSELVIDCGDPEMVATFWAGVLDLPVVHDEEDGEHYYELAPPGGAKPTLLFLRVPEGKTVKNRLHIDVSPVESDRDTEVERIVALGATRIDIGQGDTSWVVLADPEGNEFCVLRGPIPPPTPG